ncbi:MAG TPA: ADP-ribosylation factor-like protein, partial [Niastella sp.]
MSELAIKLINEAYEKKSTFLDLGNCGLEEVPKEIMKLKDTLQGLNLGPLYLSSNLYYNRCENGFKNNRIANNGQSLLLLKELPFLTSLYLMANEIGDSETEYISQLSNLTVLSLSGNRMSESGIKHLRRLSALTVLDLAGNEIGHKGAEDISTLSTLTSLRLYNNSIGDKGAASISQLPLLTLLDLGKNQISDQGVESFSRLSNLTILFLEENRIGDLGAAGLSRLSRLTSLSLSGNNIGNQGAEYLSHLTALTSLDLSNNNIGSPGAACISQLPILTDLNLAGNNIDKFDGIISPALKTFKLQNNLIEELSVKFIKNSQLEIDFELKNFGAGKIYLHGNPVKNVPREVLDKGRSAILEYLSGALKPLNECKLIFVGDGSVGKTSLMKRLVYGEFNSCEITTHGINKIAWKGIKNEQGESIKVNCWDFGGQHIQHSLHQFFFTQRVVYVLVLNPRNDERAGYWLDQIDKLGHNSQIIIVYNWKNKQDIQADYLRNFRELRKTYTH